MLCSVLVRQRYPCWSVCNADLASKFEGKTLRGGARGKYLQLGIVVPACL